MASIRWLIAGMQLSIGTMMPAMRLSSDSQVLLVIAIGSMMVIPITGLFLHVPTIISMIPRTRRVVITQSTLLLQVMRLMALCIRMTWVCLS